MINELIKAIILLLTLIALIIMMSKWIIKNILKLIKDLWVFTAQKFAEQYEAYNAKYNSNNPDSIRRRFIENFTGIPATGTPVEEIDADLNDFDSLLEEEVSVPSQRLPPLGKLMTQNVEVFSVPSWETQLKKNLQPYLEQNYRIIEKINSLPQDWENSSIRQLKKFCTEINQIRQKTITGHASKKTNKRLLIHKIKKLANC